MRGNLLRLFVGLAPFVLLGGALVLFTRTGDVQVFTYAGVLAALYVFVLLLVGRRRARRAPARGRAQRRSGRK